MCVQPWLYLCIVCHHTAGKHTRHTHTQIDICTFLSTQMLPACGCVCVFVQCGVYLHPSYNQLISFSSCLHEPCLSELLWLSVNERGRKGERDRENEESTMPLRIYSKLGIFVCEFPKYSSLFEFKQSCKPNPDAPLPQGKKKEASS